MKSLIVSLHDVSPLTQSLCERILLDLSELGVREVSLLIIPNHHGRAPVAQNSPFQRWLTREVDAGHEPVLHGYFHRRQKRRADPWFSKITTEIYTDGEGEFFDLSFDLAKKSLCDGLADLAFLPRKVTGFVAPAWLLGDAAEQAVRSLGFVYTTRIGCIRIFKPLARKSDEPKRPWDFRAIEPLRERRWRELDLKGRQTERGLLPTVRERCGVKEVKSRSLVWSTREPWRIVASFCWNRALVIAESGAAVLRVSIHPEDVQHKPVWRQIREIIGSARRARECISYERLVGRLCM
jgi:uncharacterized protein